MRTQIIGIVVGGCLLTLLLWGQSGFAQGEGFITPLSSGSDTQSEALPAGAVRQGSQVAHVIASNENLHLLAAYYYGDPRQWTRIYRDNQQMLRNPNVLPVGQTLQISVEAGWTPVFDYEEWFRLATRNGEWVPGQWQRASRTPQQGTPLAVTPPAPPEPAAPVVSPEAPEAIPPQPPEAQTTPTTPPVEVTPAAQPTPAADPTPAVEEPPQAQEPPQEEDAPEEQAPAF